MNELDWTDVLVATGLYPEESEFSHRDFDARCSLIMDGMCDEVLDKLANEVQLNELQKSFLEKSRSFVGQLYLRDEMVGHLWNGLYRLQDVEFMFYFKILYKWMWLN